MAKDNIVLDYVLDVTPDINRQDELRHVIDLDKISQDTYIRHHFIDNEEVSLRALFNNLDGDDRAGRDYLESPTAGTLLAIAALHKLAVESEDDEEIQKHPGFENMHEVVEEEFNNVFSASVNNMCSFLFGRHVLTDEFKRIEFEAYEQMYDMCENLLWTLVMTLTDEVNELHTVGEILIEDPTLYTVARWEDDFMLVTFMSANNDISPNAFFSILTRGIASEQRYYSTHRSGSRHQSVSNRSGNGR